MRNLAILGAAALAGACTSTFAEPRLLVSPYFTVYRLHGDVAMQSAPTPGTLQDNVAQPTRAFGLNGHENDVGVRVDLGDGFAGLRLDYLRLDQGTTRSSILDGDWGRLLAGDEVRGSATMDEFRLGWLEPILTARTNYRDQPLVVKVAAGAQLAHRDLTYGASTLDGARSQKVGIDGDVAFAALRVRATWRSFGVEGDYAISPGLALGGDYEDLQQDLEMRVTYNLPLHDVTFFAGFRYSQLQGEGRVDGFGYDADLSIDGYQFGVTLVF